MLRISLRPEGSDVARAAADEDDGAVARHLQALHQAQRHEVTDVQAVRRRVKADVEGRLAVVDHFADLRLVRDLRDQAARLQLFINTHCIFSLSLFDLVSRRQFHETAAEKL